MQAWTYEPGDILTIERNGVEQVARVGETLGQAKVQLARYSKRA